MDNGTGDMLQRVWQELNNWIDVYRVRGDAHIERLINHTQNNLMLFNTQTAQFHWARVICYQD